MRRRKAPAHRLAARLTLILAISAVLFSSVSAQAAPHRLSSAGRAAADSTQFNWWLVSRALNKIICVIVIGHAGEPTVSEVADSCGADLAQEWQETPACPYDPARTTPCTGVYLRPGGAAQVVQPAALAAKPGHVLWLELPGCTREREKWGCDGPPSLRVIAEDTDPTDSSSAVLVQLGSETSKCPGATCDVQLEATPAEGLEITFWSTLASGGVSQRFSGRVRVVEEPEGAQPKWKVDLLSAQFKDDLMDRCGLAWDALPPLGDRPSWLDIPDVAEDLRSSEAYAYLEERLAGLGLQAEGAAGDGALFAPAEMVAWTSSGSLLEAWQNQFDSAIVDAASTRGLPPRVLKSLFAAESQFWPGSFPEVEEAGLGQLSELGADSLLLWSPSFFAEFCPQILHPSTCSQGYSSMPNGPKAMLRAALLGRVNADCADCAHGLDLSKAERSVAIFAESLVASCSQTGRMIYNLTGKAPGRATTYEDLWRLSLANYNAGSGCMAEALTTIWQRGQPLNWIHVASGLPEGCQGGINYVIRVLERRAVEIGPQSSLSQPISLANE